MAFIDPETHTGQLLIGPEDGARTLFRGRYRYEAGFFVGLHTHDGDESFQVLDGEVRFVVGGERKVCRAGEIVFVPAGVEHGFVSITDSTIDVISQQRMGIYAVVLNGEGERRFEEIFIKGFPSSREVPEGQDYTPREHVRALYTTTRHLL